MRPSWRTIPGFPDYEVSSTGAMRRGTPGRGTWAGRRLALCRDRGGYLYACLAGPRLHSHVAICLAFHGPKPTPLHQAAHRDGRKRHNTPRNCRWATFEENCADKRKHGRCKGGRNPAAKLTPAKVRRIRAMARRGRLKQEAIGRRFGITQQAVSRIALRQQWAHVK